ncbi:GGDEF domain-containing protein [Mobilitalea sibirica]|uniref:GGDEF domain-containing protein n=1 Tax=Mobilitalea sibirica TaxID=1462919 RepID=A0A8J7HA52_9FIRM|nr:GGDEF domain-containing protein [Mobilitalea sibirica]MBH1941926.1 GGDEF domain-containing protein [Mobilitalea sibirica]
MFNNGRKTIGVFISQVVSDFQGILCRGISTRAQELNYNVAYFTNYGGYGQPVYDIGESRIADLPSYEDLDGIIITPDTLAIDGLEARIRKHIKESCSCPVVSVRRKIDEYYNVLIDDNTVIEDIIHHFINVHGFTRFNFLAGPKGFPDSDKRLESFKKVLASYGIPFEEERLHYGDFWKREGYRAVDKWLSSPLERPQAIICANDYMAVTVCNALEQRGISVPGDIAVSGCDDIEDAAEYSPAITTARMPILEMGIEAVNKIFNHMEGIPQDHNSYLKTVSIYRESCGCMISRAEEDKKRKRYYISTIDSMVREVSRNAYMSADLTGLTKLEEVNDRLRFYVYENVGFTDFYMCLHNDWQTYNEDNNHEDRYNSDEMLMEVGIKNRVDYSKIKFLKKDLIPPEFADDKPMIYFFAMLHHQGVEFGYIAISFEQIQTYMMTFQAWLINVSNALENVRVHSELNRLVYKLEDMYIRDELTGLYNRRGLEILGEKYLKQAKDEHIKMMIFTADMDKLKSINDNYGHVSGDIAIQAIADALLYAADDDEICMRMGGDEFTVIGLEYDESKINRFVKKFVEFLDKFNQSGQHDFSVYVSYGWSLLTPDINTTIEDCLIVADSKMYQQKYEKEALRLRANLVR